MKTIKEAKQRTLNPFPVAISSMHLLYLSRLGGFSLEGIRISMHAKLLQSCPTLCNPMHCSLPGSSVHRILQAKMLEWVAMPSSRGSSQLRDQTQVSCTAGGFFTS